MTVWRWRWRWRWRRRLRCLSGISHCHRRHHRRSSSLAVDLSRRSIFGLFSFLRYVEFFVCKLRLFVCGGALAFRSYCEIVTLWSLWMTEWVICRVVECVLLLCVVYDYIAGGSWFIWFRSFASTITSFSLCGVDDNDRSERVAYACVCRCVRRNRLVFKHHQRTNVNCVWWSNWITNRMRACSVYLSPVMLFSSVPCVTLSYSSLSLPESVKMTRNYVRW